MNFTGDSMTENIRNRLHKKLVKLRFEHGADVTGFPGQISTTLDRVPNYYLSVIFHKCGPFWCWETRTYKNIPRFSMAVKFAYGGKREREYRGGKEVMASPYYQKSPRVWNTGVNVSGDSPTFISDMLDAAVAGVTTALEYYNFPDVYVKRGRELVLERECLESDKHLITEWWRVTSEACLTRVDDYTKFVKEQRHPPGIAERWMEQEQNQLAAYYKAYKNAIRDVDAKIREVPQ